MNHNKTDGGRLIYNYGCIGDWNTAARKMEAIIAGAKGNVTILAQHVIQSFAHGEVTPEEAHEIGKKFADEFLGGKYKYVLTTHIDKEHIHNHLIFCNVDNFEKKSFEYTRNRGKNSWKDVRNLSDKICLEYQKSVVPENETSEKGGKKYCKYMGFKVKESFRQKLMLAIDHTILESKNFDDFLSQMRERGIYCEYVPEHKITLKFRMPEAQKNIRAAKLGFDYDENGIRRRIDDMVLFRTGESAKAHKTRLIDTTTERMREAPALSKWAEIRNIQEVAKSLNLLTNKSGNCEREARTITDKIGELNRGIDVVSGVIYNLETVKKHKPIIDELRELRSKHLSKKKAELFAEAHKKEIADYNRAESILREVKSEHGNEDGKYLPIGELKKQVEQMKGDRDILKTRYKNLKKEMQEIDTARKEVQEYLDRNADLLNLDDEPRSVKPKTKQDSRSRRADKNMERGDEDREERA